MNELADAAKAGRRVNVLGIFAIIFGILAMMAPGITGMSITLMVGMLVIAGGIVRMVWAFGADSFGQGLLKFAIGGLTLLCGIALVSNPILGSGILTIVLVIYFIADGIAEIAAGFQARPEPGAGWLIFAGIVSVLLGLMIWRQFPLAGSWAIGVLFGIKLFMTGLLMVTTGSTVRSLAKG